jgi:hypothetical protein
MAALLTNQTSDVLSDAVELSAGTTTVVVNGVLGGANLLLLLAATTDGEYQAIDSHVSLVRRNIDVSGTCFLKARLAGASAATNVTVLTL